MRQALRHRGIAMRLVQQRLSAPVESAAEADALMASACCLTAETALDVDTMTDYLSIARGSYIINQAFVLPLNKDPRNRSVFSTITLEMQASKLMAAIEDQSKDLALIIDFQEAVRGLRPLCKTEAELQYQQGLWRSIKALPTSSLEGESAPRPCMVIITIILFRQFWLTTWHLLSGQVVRVRIHHAF